jgi:hypothetical protein
MSKPRLSFLLLVVAVVLAAAPAAQSQSNAQPPAQARPDPAKLLAVQREALAKLASLDGTWRGEAWSLAPDGRKHTLTQTERVGPFLDGAVRVIEGRGYEADGKLAFNAFGTIAFDPASGAYSMHSHAQGRTGDFPVTVTIDGFSWEIPVGTMTIRYTAVVKDGVWTETGERLVPAQEPVAFFGMRLERLGDTDWPAGGAVGPRQ